VNEARKGDLNMAGILAGTKVWLVVVMVFFVLGCPTAGMTQTDPPAGAIVAERPNLVVGDTWVWTYGTEKFAGEEGDNLLFEHNITFKRYRTRDLNLVKTISAEGKATGLRDPHSGFLQFPLFVGKSWSHSYENNGIPRGSNYSVKAYEQISVKAGTFMAFRVEGEDKRLDRPYGILISYWYSPQAKAIVKFEGVDGSNLQSLPGWQYELVRHSPVEGQR